MQVRGDVKRGEGGDKVVEPRVGYKVHRDLIQVHVQGAFKPRGTARIRLEHSCLINEESRLERVDHLD